MSTVNNIIAEELIKFDSIFLEDLYDSRLMKRIDTKFLFDVADLSKILNELKKDYQVLDVEGKRLSTYESLYLDGPNFPFFLAHHNQMDHRFKVRFRKYVETDTVFLEVKEKRKGRTVKHRIECFDFEEEPTDSSLSFVNTFVDVTNLKPSLWNTYDRINLVHRELNERVTIDLGLQHKWGDEEKKFTNLAIAELKQERIYRDSPFFQLMKSLMIRPYLLSKYCIGMIDVRKNEGLKYNRFKKKIRMIKNIENAS